MAYPSTADQGHRFSRSDDSAAAGPALAADADARPIRARRTGSSWLLPVLLALVAIAAFAYYLWEQNRSREAALQPPAAAAPASPTAAEAPAAVEHPIEQASGSAPPSIE